MIIKIYSVFDAKTEAYMQPFFSPAKGHAIRMFSDTANDPNSMLAKHPGDFTLFELGSWDDSSGSIEPLKVPNPIISAHEVIKA